MAATAHLHETVVRAAPDDIWSTVTDAERSLRFLHRVRVDSSFRPGAKWRLVRDADDVDVVEGEVVTSDAPRRLVVTWRSLDAEAADEPASRVELTLRPVRPDVTHVTLRHDDLALSPLTWHRTGPWWGVALASLKTYLETGEPLPPWEGDRLADTGVGTAAVEGQWHRAQAVTANNATWELLDERPLRPEEVDELLERAYAAAYHWRRARGATVVNRARAAYLLSRAHAACGHGELALHHAERCSELVGLATDDTSDFDHAYAYEARARALACLGRLAEARELRRRATSVRIADDQDRSIFESDLRAGPWFALDP